MTRFWCILLAFCILSCGGNSTGPEIESEPEQEPEPIPNHEAGDLIIDLPGGVKMAFIWVEPGTLIVATPLKHPSTREILDYLLGVMEIPKGFYFGKYELTQQQWEKVMLTSPWPKRDEDGDGFPELDYPAYNISWLDAKDFAKKLTTLQNDGGIYRLPTSEEWEYASRAGAITPWFFGNRSGALSDYAWWGKNADSVQIVGTKLPNPWGFYDIYGNVWEMVLDHRDAYPAGIITYRKGGSYDTTNAGDVSDIFFPHIYYYAMKDPRVGVRILREGPKVSQP